jgi:hypothetical protein
MPIASTLLVAVVFPLWVVAGVADWACHLRTGLARTSGLKENLLHLLMFAEAGAMVAAIALLEFNAGLLLVVFAVFVLHELTVYWDLRYSTLLRDVGPFEQMVHSFLELLPLVALALVVVGTVGEGVPVWSLRPKDQPLPANILVVGAMLVGVFNLIPLLQETLACLLVRSGRGAVAKAVRARTPPSPEPR